MKARKYTLPRHTNLAPQGPRIGAFLIDLAIFVAITLGLIYGCFRFVFSFKTAPLKSAIKEERISSHLFFEDEQKNLIYFDKNSDNKEFIDSLAYFYTSYIPSKDVSQKEELTTSWFNLNILDVEGDGSAYFEYVKVGEEVDKNTLANIKEGVNALDVNKYLQTEWLVANETLNKLSTFRDLNNELGFYNSLEIVPSALIASTITYILIPILFKDGITFGKKVFGLCLANNDGYTIEKHQLLMRAMPLDIVILSLLLPIWKTRLVGFVIFVFIFLVSFSLAMASPKKCSLHDFTGRTIVVNKKTSILFESVSDEEEYIAKEDSCIACEQHGEEPDLRYEK